MEGKWWRGEANINKEKMMWKGGGKKEKEERMEETGLNVIKGE